MNQQAIPARTGKRSHLYIRIGTVLVAIFALCTLAMMWWWNEEPATFDPVAVAKETAQAKGQRIVPGIVTGITLVNVANVLLDKRGGYLSNDKLPPGVLLDNLPNWEYGVLTQVRDLSKAFRNDFSRSQTQSVEDPDLTEADPLFSSPNDRWLLPSSERQFGKGIAHVEGYLARLADTSQNTHFYARADNLADWLALVEKRLGSLSQRLSAAAGQVAPAPSENGEATAGPVFERTPWLKIDDVFYEARGSTWALLHFLKAVQADFEPVLRDKNAQASLAQIIHELEETQGALHSPMVLNGTPFGFFANHSLVMANYISRANAAIIDLRLLLERG
ncbi:MAG: DUF2333 family protein [Lysobacteraceae bacterium]